MRHIYQTQLSYPYSQIPIRWCLIDGDQVIQVPDAVLVLHPLPGGSGDVPPADPPPGPRHQENEPVHTEDHDICVTCHMSYVTCYILTKRRGGWPSTWPGPSSEAWAAPSPRTRRPAPRGIGRQSPPPSHYHQQVFSIMRGFTSMIISTQSTSTLTRFSLFQPDPFSTGFSLLREERDCDPRLFWDPPWTFLLLTATFVTGLSTSSSSSYSILSSSCLTLGSKIKMV